MPPSDGDSKDAPRGPQDDVGTCLFAAALEALTVPFIVLDPHRIVLANPEWKRNLTAGADPTGMKADSFLHESNIEAGYIRRTHLHDRGITLDDVRVRARSLDGRDLRILATSERISFGGAGHGVLIMNRKVDDHVYSEYVPLTRFGRRRPSFRDRCIHEAVFEAMPIPVFVTRGRAVVNANLQMRLLFQTDDDLIGTPVVDLVNPDGAAATAERQRMLQSAPGQALRSFVTPLAGNPSGRKAVADAASFLADGDVHTVVVVRSLST